MQKKSVSLLIHYCSSLVNSKMLLATSKSYPRDLKFESVGYFFMRNGNFSRKIELFNFWHISTMVWATLSKSLGSSSSTFVHMVCLDLSSFEAGVRKPKWKILLLKSCSKKNFHFGFLITTSKLLRI